MAVLDLSSPSDFSALVAGTATALPSVSDNTPPPTDINQALTVDDSLNRLSGGISAGLSELSQWGLGFTTQAAQIAANIKAIGNGGQVQAATPPQKATAVAANAGILGSFHGLTPGAKNILFIGGILLAGILILKKLR